MNLVIGMNNADRMKIVYGKARDGVFALAAIVVFIFGALIIGLVMIAEPLGRMLLRLKKDSGVDVVKNVDVIKEWED